MPALVRVARLPDTKNGTVRNVPPSPAAVEAIKGLPRAISGPVFATTASAVKQSWVRAVARARRNYPADCKTTGRELIAGFLYNLTFHDLRHEGTSRLAEFFPMHKLVKITGHKDSRMSASVASCIILKTAISHGWTRIYTDKTMRCGKFAIHLKGAQDEKGNSSH